MGTLHFFIFSSTVLMVWGQTTTTTTLAPVFPTNCTDAMITCEDIHDAYNMTYSCAASSHVAGVFNKTYCGSTMPLYCDFGSHGKRAWTIIQRRGPYGNPTDFFDKNLRKYRQGFGQPAEEYWIGLEYIHRFTQQYRTVLMITLETFTGKTAYVTARDFTVGNRTSNYQIDYSSLTSRGAVVNGPASQSMPTRGTTFHTKTNPISTTCRSGGRRGGWWFTTNCWDRSNLNGDWYRQGYWPGVYRGIKWYSLIGWSMSLKHTEMRLAIDNERWCEQDLNGTCTSRASCDSNNHEIAVADYCGATDQCSTCSYICCAPVECQSWDYIDQHISHVFGGIHIHGYVLDPSCGVFIATGVDLGQYTEDEIKALGVSEDSDLFYRIRAYLDLKTLEEVIDAGLNYEDLTLTINEARQLDEAVRTKITSFTDEYGSKMSKHGEAVLYSLYLTCGDLVNACKCSSDMCDKNFLKLALYDKTATDDDLQEALTQLLLCYIKNCVDISKIRRIAKELDFLMNGSGH